MIPSLILFLASPHPAGACPQPIQLGAMCRWGGWGGRSCLQGSRGGRVSICGVRVYPARSHVWGTYNTPGSFPFAVSSSTGGLHFWEGSSGSTNAGQTLSSKVSGSGRSPQALWLWAQRMPHTCPTAASPKHFRHSSVITSFLHQLALPNARFLIAKCN